MKKPITLALALLALTSLGQPFNRTYDINGNTDYLVPSFVITTERAESITLSMAYDAPGVPRTDYFIITKNNCDGKLIYNNRIYPNNSPTDGITNVEALIETWDGGMFIAGYHYDNRRHIEQPMLIKVDANGNLVPGQTHIYYVNQAPIFNSQMNKISLCRVEDRSGDESYFIVASGDSDHNPGVDVVTNVIRVDRNGDMGWSKKYYNGSERYEIQREYPGDVAYSPRKDVYMIAGYRFTTPIKENSMYFLSIDNAGNPIDFKTLVAGSVPIDQDMVYDPNRDEFAVTFTHEKDLYVPGTSSIIGYLRVDCAMNIYDPTYIWHKQGSAHNGRSISLTSNRDEYVICSGIYDPDMNVHNPAWVKVDVSGRPISKFMRYNIKDDVYFGHHQLTRNCYDGSEEFILVNEHKTDLRLIRTDANGEVCGARSYEPRAERYDLKETNYRYYTEDQRDYKPYDPKEKMFDPKVRECKEGSDGYRQAAVTGISQITGDNSSMVMYPSVMSLSDARLTVENNSEAAMKIEMYNIAGQLILTNTQVPAGKSEIQLNAAGSLSQGLYLVKVYDAQGALTATTKLLITK